MKTVDKLQIAVANRFDLHEVAKKVALQLTEFGYSVTEIGIIMNRHKSRVSRMLKQRGRDYKPNKIIKYGRGSKATRG